MTPQLKTWVTILWLGLSASSQAADLVNDRYRSLTGDYNVGGLSILMPDGEEYALEQLPAKARLINIWAKWCAPCRREMPDLAELQQMHGGADFEVMAIALDETRLNKVIKTLKRWKSDTLTPYRAEEARLQRALVLSGAWRAKGPDGQIITSQEFPQSGSINVRAITTMPVTLVVNASNEVTGVVEGAIDWTSPDVTDFITDLKEKVGDPAS